MYLMVLFIPCQHLYLAKWKRRESDGEREFIPPDHSFSKPRLKYNLQPASMLKIEVELVFNNAPSIHFHSKPLLICEEALKNTFLGGQVSNFEVSFRKWRVSVIWILNSMWMQLNFQFSTLKGRAVAPLAPSLGASLLWARFAKFCTADFQLKVNYLCEFGQNPRYIFFSIHFKDHD